MGSPLVPRSNAHGSDITSCDEKRARPLLCIVQVARPPSRSRHRGSARMTPVCVWFDESGFTGEDLVNPDQRYFALASSIINDEEASDILHQCFPDLGGDEAKFTMLLRRHRYRPGLLKFASMLPALGERTFAYLIDKRFSLLIKLVDYLIEPLVYGSGRDFYADGYARAYVNTLYADLLKLGPPGLLEETTNIWNTFARAPSEQTMDELKAFLTLKATELDTPLSSFYRMAAGGADEFLSPGERFETFTDSNELQVTSMLNSVMHWRTMTTADLSIVHDESSSFFKQRRMWNALTRDDAPSFKMLAASGMSAIFPLRVVETRSERSERSRAVQLCDVLAGMFTRLMPVLQGKRDPFALELFRAGVGDASFSGVMPERERVSGLPPERDGPDMIDQMSEVMRPAIEEIIRKHREKD
jgi:hypothetical protein